LALCFASCRASHEPAVLLAAAVVLLAISGIGPRDRFTWILEVAPILIGIPVLVATRRRFPLTPLAWDTQWDMFLALLGGLSAQLVLGRMHDRQLAAR
jgi:uncharacterized membrane protein YjdF